MSCFKYIGSHWTDVPRGGNHQPENKKSHIFLCYQCLEPDPNMQLDVFVSIGFKMVWIWKGISCTYSLHGAIVPIHCSPQVKLKWRAFFVVARMTCHGSCGLMTWIDEVSEDTSSIFIRASLRPKFPLPRKWFQKWRQKGSKVINTLRQDLSPNLEHPKVS